MMYPPFRDPERPPLFMPPPVTRNGLTGFGVVLIVLGAVGIAAVAFGLGWTMALDTIDALVTR